LRPPSERGTTVAAFVSNTATHDSRVLREAATLGAAGFEVVLFARWEEGLPLEEERDGFRIRRVPIQGLLASAGRALPARLERSARRLWRARLVDPAVRGLRRFLERTPLRLAVMRWCSALRDHVPPAAVYHAHDLTMLPIAARFRARQGGALVYDSHELYLETQSMARLRPLWRSLWFAYERHHIARCDAVITVNESIAEELATRYALRTKPTIVQNCPPRWRSDTEDPRTDHLRRHLGISSHNRIALYQGGLTAFRGIEQLVEALRRPGLERLAVVCLGYGPLRETLRAAATDASLAGRLYVVDAVPPDVLLEWVSSADVAIIYTQPVCMNHRLVSPNKLFESLAAGTPVVASRLPEIQRVMARDDVGALVDPYRLEELVAGIRSILDQPPDRYAELRKRCRKMALGRYNWEREGQKLIDVYYSIVGRPAKRD